LFLKALRKIEGANDRRTGRVKALLH